MMVVDLRDGENRYIIVFMEDSVLEMSCACVCMCRYVGGSWGSMHVMSNIHN